MKRALKTWTILIGAAVALVGTLYYVDQAARDVLRSEADAMRYRAERAEHDAALWKAAAEGKPEPKGVVK